MFSKENRYQPVSDEVYEVLQEIRNNVFPELGNAKIMCVFDTKKKERSGKLVLADIKKCGEFEKYLTSDNDTDYEGFDYIIRINQKAWELASPENKTRLIRHELRHTIVDNDAKKPYKLRGHSIEDFYSEVELNRDDPRWAESLTMQVVSAYEMEKEVKGGGENV
jgi:hypothetical protein